MEGRRPQDATASNSSRHRSAGPQGTQLFQADELRAQAEQAASPGNTRASVAEPVLEGVSPGIEGRRYTLRAGRQTIGRRDDNDIILDEPSVSSSHAWILNQQGHHVVMNMLSTNGTFVNDERVHEATLKHGDRVRLGQAEFVFLTREAGDRRIGARHWLVGALLLAAIVLAFTLIRN
ncbi:MULTISPECIES: FHA domain-containing protein [unclassified Guyparkeria]|uniref:FHA domain-containing protein n=1 Tax=unclassified Guyparkeria TaxID=2626246 RepID=UPI0007333B6F|nr:MULTISPECIES: FHA domain-containing protein [unclassified Guyparkeria]KTG16628.1 forkhead-associated protein [Guyparkeria sp. XI15]OAE85662.1 forkhead-associated protein [Guyparkeria sp. WRN-7]